MKHIKSLLLALTVVFITGCESELEIEPRQSISSDAALSTEANILNLLIGTYNSAGGGGIFGGQSQIISDLMGATDQVSFNGSFVAPREFFTKAILINNGFVNGNWSAHYTTINNANIVIDNLDIITSDTGLRNVTEGEAKFLRALSYFDLVRLYGQQYNAGGNNTQMGVPLRLTGLIDFSNPSEINDIARSSVEEIYTQIISDLNDALSLLPDSNDIFADNFAAQALLARVYLQQGNFTAARDAANDVLENSGHSLTSTFAGAFNNDADSSEDIFTFDVNSQDGAQQLITFYANQANGGRGADIRVEQGYFDLFDDPMNDDRRNFVTLQPAIGAFLTDKYTNQFGNIPILRIAEMHLIRAEANFRLGTSIGLDPLVEINTLRTRSNATALVGPLTLDLILNERQLELAFEGHLLFDLKRTDGMAGGFSANADNLILPIPVNELNTNDLIMQNPGYGQ